ncbi:methyltransferase domain-containing protein [Gordonia jinghuaiqii]|uniref:Class I SAM-dependent methyltransferase n=1 Tax=Gordonia jinghuaiqii TaxID=2758710 RepID=A0A7D7QX98_9ACTN|nr:class I SAM-dependent methyltransferase [Gordonia jinghuaiqii]MCR5979112.1 methyltransferase domain-containing protein [Gordonia jinghuaiqii]QMT01569.1 class I SAM-dependent methyltransferase [Gordonia jinghuaiqii]
MSSDDVRPDTAADSDRPDDSGSAQEWDERYRSSERLWTSEVNPALVAEVSDLDPGVALDVGSGEGADARWLADRGWQVTALDISQVAIDRAREIDPRPTITWLRADVLADDVPATDVDLVTLHYFPIPKRSVDAARRLVDAVGPGGSILVVAHAPEGVRAHGFDPDDYLQPADFAGLLGDEWQIVTDETRERGRAAGGGHHTHDVVFRARRGPE